MKKITIYTGPVCNYCDAAKRLLTRNNAPFNEINIANVECVISTMPPTEGSPRRRCPDMTKTRRFTGYSCKVPLRAGVDNCFGWYKNEIQQSLSIRQT